jgi:hypothetical protein
VAVGQYARLRFEYDGAQKVNGTDYASVEEGHFDTQGRWVMERKWNGDQVAWGLNFAGSPVVLKIRMGSY